MCVSAFPSALCVGACANAQEKVREKLRLGAHGDCLEAADSCRQGWQPEFHCSSPSCEALSQFTLSSRCHYQPPRNTAEVQTVPFCPFSPPVMYSQNQIEQSFQIPTSTSTIPLHSCQLSLVACSMVLAAAFTRSQVTDAKYLTAGLASYS